MLFTCFKLITDDGNSVKQYLKAREVSQAPYVQFVCFRQTDKTL